MEWNHFGQTRQKSRQQTIAGYADLAVLQGSSTVLEWDWKRPKGS